MSDEQQASVSAEEILAAVGLALVAIDLSGAVVFWNQAAHELYGWTAEEAVGRQLEELTVPEVGNKAAGEITSAPRDGSSWSGGLSVRQKDGSVFPALVTEGGICRNGRVVGFVVLTATLGSAVRPFLERSTDAALLLRSDAVVTYMNPSAQQLFGWKESIVGTSVLPLLHPDERSALARLMQDVVAHPAAHRAVEIRVLTENGWVWAEAALISMLDDPEARGVVCSLRPSLRHEAHESAELLAEQLDNALRTRIIIEQAKGFLSGRYGYAPDDGFDRLRAYARSHNLRIHEVAHRVLTGRVDLSTS